MERNIEDLLCSFSAWCIWSLALPDQLHTMTCTDLYFWISQKKAVFLKPFVTVPQFSAAAVESKWQTFRNSHTLTSFTFCFFLFFNKTFKSGLNNFVVDLHSWQTNMEAKMTTWASESFIIRQKITVLTYNTIQYDSVAVLSDQIQGKNTITNISVTSLVQHKQVPSVRLRLSAV